MNHLKKFIKNCPLVIALLISWAIVATAENLPLIAKETHNGQIDTGELTEGLEETEDTALKDTDSNGENGEPDAGEIIADNLSDTSSTDRNEVSDENSDDAVEGSPDAGTTEKNGSEDSGMTDPAASGNELAEEEKPQKIKPEYLTYKKKQTDSPWYTDPGKIPLTTEYDYQEVGTEYFDDAVFIGDSRVVGMNDYSGLTNATFFAKTGLTIYNLLDEEFVKDPASGKEVSVSYMMQHYKYGKIYLMVGINELGTGGTKYFQTAYKEVLKKLRKWQPDAVIYVQSIMGVSPKKDQSDKVFNNTNIRDKNYAISKLTDGIHIFYLNINQIYEDENYNLTQELTFDGVHLLAQHYKQWVEYLQTHAVVKEAD